MQNCPACKASVLDDVKECPQCGIFFAKWQERESNIYAGNLSRYDRINKATSSEFNWTIFVLICIALAGVFYFLAQQAMDY